MQFFKCMSGMEYISVLFHSSGNNFSYLWIISEVPGLMLELNWHTMRIQCVICFYAVDNVLYTDNWNPYLEGIWSHLSKTAWLHLSDILLCVSWDCRWSYNLTTCIRSWLWYGEVPNLDTKIFSDTFTYLITTHKFLKHWLDMTHVLPKAMNCEMMLMKLTLDIFACHTAPRCLFCSRMKTTPVGMGNWELICWFINQY